MAKRAVMDNSFTNSKEIDCDEDDVSDEEDDEFDDS